MPRNDLPPEIGFLRYDIDWFCRINESNIHVASMGRVVPEVILHTLPNLRQEISGIKMKTIDEIGGIWYNRDILETWRGLYDSASIARYLCSFVVMARKGFYSFAPFSFDPTDHDYYLMAKPVPYEDFNLNSIIEVHEPGLHFHEISSFRPINIPEIITRNFDSISTGN